MAGAVVLLTEDDRAALSELLREWRGKRPYVKAKNRRTGPVVGGFRVRDAEITNSVSVATNSKTGSTTFNFKFLIKDPASPGDLKLDDTTHEGVNRSVDASASSGTYCQVAKMNGEWRLVWLDC